MNMNLRKSKPNMRQSIKKMSLLLIALTVSGVLAACGQADKSQAASEQTQAAAESQVQKVQVIATLFPQYDFVKAIGGEYAEVRLLMPPGTESHSYEPTPKDLVDIENADVFIYTSLAMEPWIEKMLTQIGPDTLVIDASKGVTMLTAEQLGLEVHEESAGEDHDDEGVDPHIWLDPVNAGIMAQNVADGLIQAMPENQDSFIKALAQYQDDLMALDTEIQNTLGKYPDRSIVFAGHYAFGYFSKRYGLNYHSPYEGFSPDSEPSPQKIASMVDFMKAENQKVVYYEELIDPKIARIIASETNADMVMLHAAHNVSKDDLAAEITYIDIMKENLRKLEEGLKAHE